MADTTVYSGLTVDVKLSEDGQLYSFGVVLDGVFTPFFLRKSGGLNDALAAQRAPEPPAPAPADPVA